MANETPGGAADGARDQAPDGAPEGSPARAKDASTPVDTRVTRRDLASWMSGPRANLLEGEVPEEYRGQRLGLPESGPGSVAGMGRRIAGLAIDWGISILIAAALLSSLPRNLATMFVFAVMVWIFTVAGGATIGKRLLGIRTTSLRGPYVDPLRALIRTVLLCLVIPAVIWDADQRGLHDRAAGTVVVRSR